MQKLDFAILYADKSDNKFQENVFSNKFKF